MVMNRITGHHAASGYAQSKESYEHYHRTIDGDGKVQAGKHSIEANAPGKKLINGNYAAHTWKLNSGNIGVSILAMGGALWGDPKGSTKYPVRLVQLEAYFKEVARLAVAYAIPVDRRYVLTHAEVQPTLGVTQKNKWDYDYDPRYASKTRDPIAIGDEMRQEIALIVKHLSMHSITGIDNVVEQAYPTLRQGSYGEYVKAMQDALRKWTAANTVKGFVIVDGQFGPNTRDALIVFQKSHQLLPDGVCGPLTWAALRPGGKP